MSAITLQAPRSFAGRLLLPGDDGYDESRSVFNGAIDRRPAAIARCTSAADVAAAVRLARDEGLEIAVRGGGHSIAGWATVDDGLVVDLGPMKWVTVDPDARTCVAQAGVTWGELDAATQAHGLAVTGGRVSHTGIAGLTLGSGSGWLERAFGLTADNLLAATVVTASGEMVRASPAENPELFWGLRGGGGNFGVVCEFEYGLHPVGPLVYAGMLLFDAARAAEVMSAYRAFMSVAPDGVGGAVALLTAPPAPFVPADAVGKPAVAVVGLYAGDPAEGEAALAPLRAIGDPLADALGPMPYTVLQSLLDPGNPWGARAHFKAAFMADLPDAAVDAAVATGLGAPSPLTVTLIQPLGGAFGRVPEDATALGHRSAKWCWHVLSLWTDPEADAANLAFSAEFAAAMEPHSLRAVHPNYVGDEGQDRVRSFYSPDAYARLVALKRRWDPQNVFHRNQNIRP